MSGFSDEAFSLDALLAAAPAEPLRPGALAALDSRLRLQDLTRRTERMIERLSVELRSVDSSALGPVYETPERHSDRQETGLDD
jgi:hypothetical protein